MFYFYNSGYQLKSLYTMFDSYTLLAVETKV